MNPRRSSPLFLVLPGLSEEDIIVGFDEKPITGIDDLHKMLTDEKVGVITELIILRRSEKLTLPIVPGESIPREP
jgi:S1-C subfamily serine protease